MDKVCNNQNISNLSVFGIGKIIEKSEIDTLSDETRIDILSNHFQPEESFTFPKSNFCNRSCKKGVPKTSICLQ